MTESSKPTVVRVELSLKSMLVVLALTAGAWLLVHLLPALLVLVTAMMVVGVLSPFVAWLEHRTVRHTFAICTVFGIGAAISLTLLTLTVPTVVEQVKTLADKEPEIRETLAVCLERSSLTAALADDLRKVRYAELLQASKLPLLAMSGRVFEIAAYSIAAVFLAF